jgi:hypothetical protein
MVIYQENQKYKDEGKLPIQMKPRMMVRKTIKREMEGDQEIEVRAWEIHKKDSH